jgi:cytidine deaminase
MPLFKIRVGSSPVRQWTNCLGSNQENAAYPSGLCAERVAIFKQAVYPEAKI